MLDCSPTDLAAKWRERAREMRDLAPMMNEPETRSVMFKLAQLYDYLAELRQGRFNGFQRPMAERGATLN
jgi:hypothetical protein